MECIFCSKENEAKSIEHIVSESFGNKIYIAARGSVCDNCNAGFSESESKALTNSIFVMERARFGIQTKKGRFVKGKVGDLKIEGHENFEKNLVTFYGLSEENTKVADPKKGTLHVTVESFDKSEVATSRMVLKTGLEALYTSKRNIYDKYDFSDLKDYLLGITNTDWPFLLTDTELTKFKSIPEQYLKYQLKKKRIILRYAELDSETLLFKFQFGSVPMLLNLVNRNLSWFKDYRNADATAQLYPKHFVTKLKDRA